MGLVHWEDPEGWDGEGGRRGNQDWGTHVNPWLIHVNVWQKPLQYCKVISLQLIKINGKKNAIEIVQNRKKKFWGQTDVTEFRNKEHHFTKNPNKS